MVWLELVGIALSDHSRDRLAHRALPTPVAVLPGQTIMLSRRADNALRVLVHLGAIVQCAGVYPLSLHVATTDLDSVELVLPYAADEDLVRPGLGVETPGVTVLHDWDRQRPIGGTHRQRGHCARSIQLYSVLDARLRGK